MIAAFEAEYGDSADNILRKMTEADWKNLSPEEKIVLTKYTQTYSYLNEPLRGKTYYSPNQSKKKAEFNNDMPLLTEALSTLDQRANKEGSLAWEGSPVVKSAGIRETFERSSLRFSPCP